MSGSNRGYSFRISAEGMQEFAQDLARLSGQSDQAHAAITRLIQASPELASSLLKAEDATKRAADRARELQDAQTRAAQAAAALPAANARMADSFDRLEGRALAARRGVADFRGALELLGAGGVSQALGPVASQIGNVADLFGTAGLAAGAFGGSASGLTALLGPLSVGIAAVGGAAYALSQSYEAAAQAQEKARLGEEAYQRAMEINQQLLGENNRLMETAAERRRREAIAANELALAIERENLARANEATSRAAGVRGRLEDAVASGRAAPGQVASGLERARATEEGLGAISASIQQRITNLEQAISNYRLMIYDQPIGPQMPLVRAVDPPAGRSSAAPRAPAQGPDQDAHVRAFQAAQQRLDQQQQAEERRREQEIQRFEKQSLDAFARIGENAMDRIGGSLVDAFVRGEQAALNFGNIMRGVIASAATDLIKLGLINPFVNSTFGLARPTLGGAAAAMGGGGGAMDLLGLGGAVGGMSGLMSTSIPGTGGVAQSMGDLGFYADPATLNTATGTTLGGASFGSVLGAAGMGAMGGGMLASMTGGNSTGGSIGGGIGAGIGMMVGGPVGAFIGGAAGGMLGGLIGPKGKRPGFYNVGVEAGADGMLSIASAGGKRADKQLEELRKRAEEEIKALNNQMAALGLRASGSVNLGANVAGANQLMSMQDAIQTNRFRLRADDARMQTAIDRVGGDTFAGQMEAAQSADALIKQIDAFAQAARDAEDPLGAVRRQFDGVREGAERLGFGLDEVNKAQERALREATARLMAPVVGGLDGLADYARSLRTANDNGGTPMSRLAAAQAEFERLSQRAAGGDASAINRFQAAAEQFRGLSRDVFGTGRGGVADAEARIAAALEQIGNVGADALTASVLQATQREQTDTLVAALGRVQDEVRGLRREVQQAQRNPLVA